MQKGLLTTLIILISILILISGGLLFWLVSNRTSLPGQTPSSIKPISTPTPTPTLAPDSSENLPDTEANSDLQQIKQAFAQKYNKDLDEVKVTIKENENPYMSGGVNFSGEIAGGWFLAYNGNEGWTIVADGNGTVMCSDIQPYDFSTAMVPECWDGATGQLVTR